MEAWKRVADESGYGMEDSLFVSCVGRNDRDTKRIVLDALGGDFPYEEFKRRANATMRDEMERNGPPPMPGARELLTFLYERGMPLALATSTSEASATWMLDRAGFSRFFRAKAFGTEVTHGKPSPEIFKLALSRLGSFRPEATAVFEDSAAGIRAASAAGMLPVFVPDMIQPTDELLSLVWRRIPSLSEAISTEFFSITHK